MALLNDSNVVCKNRILRFTKYESNNKSYSHDQKNYLIVNRNNNKLSREELKTLFEDITPIGKYFIATDVNSGMTKGYGIVEVLDDDIFNILLNDGVLVDKDGTIFEIQKWKMQKIRKNEGCQKLNLIGELVNNVVIIHIEICYHIINQPILNMSVMKLKKCYIS